MIIDFHVHIVPPDIHKEHDRFVEADPIFASMYSSRTAKTATAEELVSAMDEAGIDMSVVVNIGWSTSELCARTNDYILESAAKYPRRLVALCAVQPRDADLAVKEIERCARGGAKGIGELRPDDQGFDIASKAAMSPIVKVLQKHNMMLLTHASEPVGHVYSGKGKVTPGQLYPFICNFPDLKIILAHWGGGLPFYALMPEVKAALANTFFDCAATPFLYSPQIFEHMADIVGVDKILFATDYPLMRQKRVIDQIESTRLSTRAKTMILGGNAALLLGMG